MQHPVPSVSEFPAPRALVVLGDSLSDTGNAGRFCDGPVWVEILARAFGFPIRPAKLGGTNYAVGGARVAGGDHDLPAQVDRLCADMGGRLDPEALYVVYAGGNDTIASMAQLRCGRAVAAAARSLAATVERLGDMGAQCFLVPNLPDLGLAPVATMLPARLARAARATTVAFNRQLRHSLRCVSANRALTIIELDVFAEVDAMVADGAGPGLLFCDRLHPAASIHRHIAAVALRAFGVGNSGNPRAFWAHHHGGASMPAKSAAQQKAAGAALSAKRGETPKSKLQGASKSMEQSMSQEELERMASTKRKGKPEHVSKDG